VGLVFVIVWELCLLLCGGCVFYRAGVVSVIVWGVVSVIVWGLCLLLSFFFGCSNLIT